MPEFLIAAWDWKPSASIGCWALIITYAGSATFDFRTACGIDGGGAYHFHRAGVATSVELPDHFYRFSVQMPRPVITILFVLVASALLLVGVPAAPFEALAARSRVAARSKNICAHRQSPGSPALVRWRSGTSP